MAVRRDRCGGDSSGALEHSRRLRHPWAWRYNPAPSHHGVTKVIISKKSRPGSLKVVACSAAVATVAAGLAMAAPKTSIVATLTPWKFPAPVYRTVAVVSSGRIFVLGGHDAAGGSTTSVFEFNPASGKSVLAGTLALPTHGAAAALVAGRVMVFGGASLQVHDAVQFFNPATRKSTVIGYMPTVRADTTAATAGKLTVLVGGFDGYGPQGEVWATDNGTSFHVIAHLPQPVRYPAAVALGAAVYVFGGLISGGEYNGMFTNDVQRVDLPTGSANVVGHLPFPVAHAMATNMAGHLFVLGGSSPMWTSKQNPRFRPCGQPGLTCRALPEPVTDAGVASIGRVTYILGGMSTNGPLASITTVRLTSG